MTNDVEVKVYRKLADLPRNIRKFRQNRLQIAFAKAETLCEIQRLVIKLRLIPEQVLVTSDDGLVF